MKVQQGQSLRNVVIVACSALLAGCDLIDAEDAVEIEATATQIADADAETEGTDATPAHWTYEGEDGPEHWGELDSDYVSCRDGESQSPIDFVSTSEQDLANITFSYEPSAVNILNKGHTIQVDYDAGSSIQVNDTSYELRQFHFHSPSEHTTDGAAHGADLHLVHQSSDDSLAVVGVFIDSGEENTALASVWENLPAEPGPVQTTESTVDAADLLPDDQRTFRYDGSLTTPPCSEEVVWLMMIKPISISEAQLAEFTEIIEANHRPVQPLNDREVQEDTSP